MDTNTTKPKVGAGDFFLYLGYIIAFYTCIATYLTFLFSLINTLFPDRQYNYYDTYGSGMRFAVSMLIVATPLCIFLLKKIYTKLREHPEQKDLWIRRWGLLLTLFLTITALAIDLVVLINTFLGGEITTRFTLKAITVLVIGAAVYWYTKQELNNTLAPRPTVTKSLAWVVAIIIIASLITGFSYIGSPTLLQHIKDDNQREIDISNIRYQIVNYYQSKNGTLPKTLEAMNAGNPYPQEIPKDPETGLPYKYQILADKVINTTTKFPTFELCATFAEDGSVDERVQNAGGTLVSRPTGIKGGYVADNETDFSKHPVGETCFKISIDPERYKPFTTTR